MEIGVLLVAVGKLTEQLGGRGCQAVQLLLRLVNCELGFEV
jgi:hypothetical protein